MPITVRGLLARVKLLRADMGSDDGKPIFCITESLRRVCRDTRCIKTILPVVSVAASSLTTTPVLSTGDIEEVESISMARIPLEGGGYPVYHGTFNPTTGAITPTNGALTVATGTASSFAGSSFFLASVTSNTDIDEITEPWAIGDVVYSDGSKWQQIKVRKFEPIEIENRNVLLDDGWSQEFDGYTKKASYDNGVISWFEPPMYDTAVSIEVSYTRTTIDSATTINIHPSAEDVIVNGAIAIYMALPGPEQDKRMALEYDRRFHAGLSNLSAISVLGESGPMYLPHASLNWRS